MRTAFATAAVSNHRRGFQPLTIPYLLVVGGTKWLRAYAESNDQTLSLWLTALLFTNKNEDYPLCV